MYAVFLVPRGTWRTEVKTIASRALHALEGAKRAAPGDHDDAYRFESLLREAELVVRRLAAQGKCYVRTVPGEGSWIPADASVPWDDAYRVALETRLGLTLGQFMVFLVPQCSSEDLKELPESSAPAPPAAVWRAPDGITGPDAAEEARWRAQLKAAAEGVAVSIVPSGVHNRTLTEGLREFVQADGSPPVRVRVVYRDGSEARAFQLRAAGLSGEIPDGWPEIRLALLSLRHPAMDADVDCCLLRNRDVSVVRPTAETDEFVYTTSLRHLRALANHGPRLVRLYQTGFEPAIVGFYRALTNWMNDGGKGLVIIPMFHRGNGCDYEPGEPWGYR